MCGLAGLIGPSFPGRRAVVAAMLARLAHRGPNGEGYHEDGPVALGHRRLAVFAPGPAADQPMVDPAHRTALVFNGAIYNYPELRAALPSPPPVPGDTAVLARRLADHDPVEALIPCIGMWAFAFWDPRRRKLWLGRDRLGVKPLYWRRWGRHIAFASEIPALLALDTLDAVNADHGSGPLLDQGALAGFLLDRSDPPAGSSFFTGIHQVPPATLMAFSLPDEESPAGEATVTTWWHPWDSAPDDPFAAAAANDPAELRALLTDAQRLRLRADVPVGFLLSGGLDSSTAVALAAIAAPDRTIAAHTLSYPGRVVDEAPFARLVAAAFPNVTLDEVTPDSTATDSREVLDRLERVITLQAEPFADGSMLAHHALMERVAARSFTVVVGGQGGDEALAGYMPLFRDAAVAAGLRGGRWRNAVQAAGSLKALIAGARHALPAGLRETLRRRRTATALARWLAPDFTALASPRFDADLERAYTSPLHAYMGAALTRWQLPGFVRYEDRNAMAFALEARSPFLDHRVIEWGFSRPIAALVDDGLGKVSLRRAMAGILPDAVAGRRDKRGLPSPARRWLLENPALLDRGLTAVRKRLPMIDAAAVARDLAAAMAGNAAPAPIADDMLDLAWRIVVAGLWAEAYAVSA